MNTFEGDRVHDDGVYHALPDALSDRMFSVLMALATEVWTVRDRLRLLESAVAAQGIDVSALVESFQGTEESLAAMRADREAFVERTFRALTPR